MLYESKTFELLKLLDIVWIYCDEYCIMGPRCRFTHVGLYWTVWDRYMEVLYLGRALRTKETLPDFPKWHWVTRHPLVFRGLTGSQRTHGFGELQLGIRA